MRVKISIDKNLKVYQLFRTQIVFTYSELQHYLNYDFVLRKNGGGYWLFINIDYQFKNQRTVSWMYNKEIVRKRIDEFKDKIKIEISLNNIQNNI